MASLKRFSALGGGVQTDPQFNLTTLLLHGDGTNGAQNNTFIDSSSNNFTITRNGNTTQGTFTPFSQTGWSVYLNGSSTFGMPAGLQTAFAGWGGRTRSWEAFVFRENSNNYSLQNAYAGVSANGRWTITIESNKLVFGWTTSTSTETSVISTASIPLGWSHLTVCVDSTTSTNTTIYLGINGVIQAFTGNDLSTQTTTYAINAIFATAQFKPAIFTGYSTGLRWSNNIRYSANYTVPTTSFVNDANTLFLLGQLNRFVDQSSNNYAITIAAGTPSVQAFSPFAPTVPYSTSVVGGSGYFDGAGDYISAPDNALLQFETGTFTIQGWVYRAVAGATHTIASKGASTPTGWVFQVNSSNQLVFTNTSTNITTTTTIPANTWTHVAAVRSGTGTNQMVLFINGVSSATGTVATNFNQTNALNIGADRSNANTFNGYISGLEIVKGSALTITVPTAPPTTSNSPSLLLNFTNAGIFDQTAKNDLETVGNAQVSTSVAKFGTGSVVFDGSGDYLQAPASVNSLLGTADFTIESWVYIAGNSALNNSSLREAGILTLISSTFITLTFIIRGDATTTGTGFQLFQNSPVTSNLQVTGTISQLTWHHIAVSRSGSSVRFFLNGTQMGATQTNSSSWGSTTHPLYVGTTRQTGFNNDLNGYIDDLRITRGFARYTANFTPPTSPFPDQ